MQAAQLFNFLDKFSFSYYAQQDGVCVQLPLKQEVIVNITDQGNFEIKDRLAGWNFLTGIIQMSLKNAIIYNCVANVLIASLIFFRIDLILLPIWMFFAVLLATQVIFIFTTKIS